MILLQRLSIVFFVILLVITNINALNLINIRSSSSTRSRTSSSSAALSLFQKNNDNNNDIPVVGSTTTTTTTMAATTTTTSTDSSTTSSSSTTTTSAFGGNSYSNSRMVGKTAVILNTNARAVSTKLAPIAYKIFGKDNVFVTTNSDEAKNAVKSIISSSSSSSQPYSLVIPVGGDGTLTRAINDLIDELMMKAQQEEQNEDNETSNHDTLLSNAIKNLPLIGYIPLGTGNGVGSSVGCTIPSSGIPLLPGSEKRKLDNIEEVMEALNLVGNRIKTRSDEDKYNVIELPMIEVCKHPKDEENNVDNINTTATKKQTQKKGDLCFFAGIGFDSLMLDDFKVIKSWSKKTGILPKMLGSVLGYCVALIVRTLPKALSRGEHRINVKITTSDKEMLWVDHRRGDIVQPIVQNMIKSNKNNIIKQYINNNNGKEKEEDSSLGTSSTKKTETTDTDTDEAVEIFSGTTGICCAGTVPYYGGGLRLFPFARLTLNSMHLRLGRINPLVGFINIPSIFAGSYRDKSSNKFGVIDFIGNDFHIEVKRVENNNEKKKISKSNKNIKRRRRRSNKRWMFWRRKQQQEQEEQQQTIQEEEQEESNDDNNNNKGYPFQHSGESMGNYERFRFRITDEKIRFVNFMERRCITCED